MGQLIVTKYLHPDDVRPDFHRLVDPPLKEIRILRLTDEERAQALLDGGYLPAWLKAFHAQHATTLLEWAFEHHMGPGWWNKVPHLAGGASHEAIADCDRPRIDRMILAQQWGDEVAKKLIPGPKGAM